MAKGHRINILERKGFQGPKEVVTDFLLFTYCVRSVKAADVIEEGKLRPLVISRQIFLLITSTSPPRSTTSLYNR